MWQRQDDDGDAEAKYTIAVRRHAYTIGQGAYPTSWRTSIGVTSPFGLRRRSQGWRRRTVLGQPLHDLDRELQPVEQPLIWVLRQRLDDCWTTYGQARCPTRIDRAPQFRAAALCLERSGPRPEDPHKLPASRRLSENVRWKFGPVVYIGLTSGVERQLPMPALTAKRVRRARSPVTRRRNATQESRPRLARSGLRTMRASPGQGRDGHLAADPNSTTTASSRDTRSYDAYRVHHALRAQTLAFRPEECRRDAATTVPSERKRLGAQRVGCTRGTRRTSGVG